MLFCKLPLFHEAKAAAELETRSVNALLQASAFPPAILARKEKELQERVNALLQASAFPQNIGNENRNS